MVFIYLKNKKVLVFLQLIDFTMVRYFLLVLHRGAALEWWSQAFYLIKGHAPLLLNHTNLTQSFGKGMKEVSIFYH